MHTLKTMKDKKNKPTIVIFADTLYDDATHQAMIEQLRKMKYDVMAFDSIENGELDDVINFAKEYNKQNIGNLSGGQESNNKSKIMVEGMNKKKKRLPPMRFILLFEDLGQQLRMFPKLTDMIKKSRHYKFFNIFVSQELTDLKPSGS